MKTKPTFKTNKEALDYYKKKYEELGAEAALIRAEALDTYTKQDRELTRLSNFVKTLKHLINKGKL